MKHFFLLTFFVLCSSVLFGQVCPTKNAADANGSFNVFQQGCVPYSPKIKSTVAAGATVTGYIYDYKLGTDYKDTTLYSIYKKTILPEKALYTYSKPGKYCIIQLGSNGTASFAAKEIEVLETPKPVATAMLCGPNDVRLTLPANPANIYEDYLISWGDGNQVAYKQANSPIKYTYAARANNNITITGIYTACGGERTNLTNLPPYTPLPTPQISSLEAKGGKLTLNFNSNTGVKTEVLQKVGGNYESISPAIFDDGTGPSAATNKILVNFSTQNTNCFRVRVADVCEKTNDSPEICNIPFTATPKDGENQISWGKYPVAGNFVQYNLIKNSSPLKTISNIATQQLIDPNVTCGEEYGYQMIVDLAGMKFISEEVRIKGNNTKPLVAIKNAYPTVENGKMLVIWTPETFSVKNYFIERADQANGAFKKVGTSLTNRFDDPTASPSSQSYCYRVSYTDQCDREAEPSKPICSVFLSENGSNLNWTPIGFAQGTVRYEVEYLDQNGNSLNPPRAETLGLSQSYVPDFSDPTLVALRFRIRAISADNQISTSNDVLLSQGVKLFVPTAFSPNGDGINDVFIHKGVGLPQVSLRVFDRWGSVIFDTNEPNTGWDGRINNQEAPQGFYTYRIEILDLATTKPTIKTGVVMLVR